MNGGNCETRDILITNESDKNLEASSASPANIETGIILIVDDNPNNLGMLSDALADTGWEILVATDGESAVEQVEYTQPELILLDVMMPGIDGFETCRRLKANPSTSDIPVIFMTALSDTVDKVKGLNLGAVDYITKPFEQEEVLARVQTQLKIRNLTKQLQMHNQLLKQEILERTAAEDQLQQLAQKLEQRVEERTSQLSIALCELQQAQVSLVQREKMSALGELVAGIAHEINNPICFISGNLTHASSYTQDLSDLLKLYQQHYPNPVSEIANKIEEIDLDYLIEDLPKIISSMDKGTERIVQIIRSLRHFSRRDDSTVQTIDIHEGIDSTLMILQHRLKASDRTCTIQVFKEYGTLPPVTCYAGPLNQVFMNILANAIDALEEAIYNGAMGDRNPTIEIRTSNCENDSVEIRIADNGLGVSEEFKQRLWEPLFTTKPVGKGTGLGLSISRQIIEETHGGCLQCLSEPGQGAVFSIQIPVQPRE